jgi:hypothetical protein
MQTNFRQVYEKMLESEKLKAEIQKAKTHFEPKPFVLEYWKLKNFSLIFSPILSFFSIITAFGFLYYQFAHNLHFIIAGFLAIVLLLALELVKLEVSNLTFKRFFLGLGNGLTYGLGLFMLALFALSVFTSVYGAKEIYHQLDQSLLKLESSHAQQRDSLVGLYEKNIGVEKQALQDFKSSISWNGKINISDKTVAQTIQSSTAKIDSLEADKRQAITLLLKTNANEITHLETDNGFKIDFWLSVSGIVEILILLSCWFKTWYQFNVSQESELLTNQATYTMNGQALQYLASLIQLHSPSSMPLNGQNDQSFLAMNELLKNLEISSKNQDNVNIINGMNENKSEVKKEKDYSGLIKDVKKGIRDMRYLTHTHRVNVPTVKKIFNQYSTKNKEK